MAAPGSAARGTRHAAARWLLLSGALWGAGAALAQQAPPREREPDAVITREPSAQPGRWQLEQVGVPDRSAPEQIPASSVPPVPPALPAQSPAAGVAPVVPRRRPRSRPAAAAIRLQQLAPDASIEERMRVPQAAGGSDICEQVLAGTRRAPPGLDCTAPPLQQPAAPPAPVPADAASSEQTAAGRAQGSSDAPGVPVPSERRSGVQVVRPQ